jgi:hypothetical protein
MSIWVGRPFDRLTFLSEVEGLTVLDKAKDATMNQPMRVEV